MPHHVNPHQLKETLGDGEELALLDVREQGVFGQGHLLLAACLPLSHLELRIADLVPRKNTRTVLVDGGADDTLAARAADRLADWGYDNVAVLAGGVGGWQAAGFELFSGVNVPSKAFGEFVERTYGTPRLTAAQLKARRDAGEAIVVLDSRPYEEFHRMSIPGGIDAPGAELVYRVHDLVPDPATTVVVNCAGRTRSIIGAQALINAGLANRVAALENGTMGWHLAGFELARGATEVAPSPSADGLAKAGAAAARVAERFGVRTVTPEKLARWREAGERRTVYLLDVRGPDEYLAGHLPGTRNAPGGQLVQATDEYMAVRNARVVLVDDTEVRAIMTASWLIQMGWTDVHVLAGGLDPADLIAGPHLPDVPGDEWPEEIEPTALQTMLAAGRSAVIDLASSLVYRDAHIPGAYWAVRARLDRQLGGVPPTPAIAVTSPDGRLAKIAAAEVAARRADAVVYALAGGTDAWRSQGLPLEAGLTRPLGSADDVQYKPYDHADGIERAMNDYLAWEVALVEQIGRDGGIAFRRYG